MFVWTCGFKSRHPHQFPLLLDDQTLWLAVNAFSDGAAWFLLKAVNHYNARVVELADSLDSGSSVLHARAGSSPASRTKKKVPLVTEGKRNFLCYTHERKNSPLMSMIQISILVVAKTCSGICLRSRV